MVYRQTVYIIACISVYTQQYTQGMVVGGVRGQKEAQGLQLFRAPVTGLAWWVEIQQVFSDLIVLLSPQGHLEESRPWGIVCHPFPAGPSRTACVGQSRSDMGLQVLGKL